MNRTRELHARACRWLALALVACLACAGGAGTANDAGRASIPDPGVDPRPELTPSPDPVDLQLELASIPDPVTDPRLETPPSLDPDPRLGLPAPPAEEPVAPPTPPAAAPATSASPVDPCLRIERLTIDKSERRLAATCTSGVERSFRVALGQLPLGHKRQHRDLRTPEGFYRIAEAPRGSRFHVFMLLDYPSLADADRALSDGYISARTYLRIARAVVRGQLPPQDTLLGGMIGIHGEGSDHQGDSSRADWTLGCIALSDADAEYIAFRVDVGTPVSIEP